MTYAELKAETSRRLAEYGGRVFYTDEDDLPIAVNDDYRRSSATATEWHEESIEINLLNDHPWYDLLTSSGRGCSASGRRSTRARIAG